MLSPNSQHQLNGFKMSCDNEKLVKSFELRLERKDLLKRRQEQIVSDVNKLLRDKDYDFIEVMGAYGDAEVVENLVHAVGFSAVQESLNLIRNSLHLCACHGEPMKYKSICMISGNPSGERDLLGINDSPYEGDC
jgi:hypothetical protein